MSFYPYNPNINHRLQSNAGGFKANRVFIAKYSWINPVLGTEDLSGLGNVASSATLVTAVDLTALDQPDVPRNVVINPDGTVTDVKACNITITGTDMDDEVITEDFAMSANQAHDTKTTGNKAFKTITGISIPAQDGGNATFLFGYGAKLGLPYKRASHEIYKSTLAGSAETITIASSASVLASNTVTCNTALDGAKDLVIYEMLTGGADAEI